MSRPGYFYFFRTFSTLSLSLHFNFFFSFPQRRCPGLHARRRTCRTCAFGSKREKGLRVKPTANLASLPQQCRCPRGSPQKTRAVYRCGHRSSFIFRRVISCCVTVHVDGGGEGGRRMKTIEKVPAAISDCAPGCQGSLRCVSAAARLTWSGRFKQTQWPICYRADTRRKLGSRWEYIYIYIFLSNF